MKSFGKPAPMLIMPAPYVRIIIDAPTPAAQIIMLSPWPGLPTPYLPGVSDVVTEWQCCDQGPVGIITAVTIHLPVKETDPAFTVKVSMDETEVEHLRDEHEFFGT